jgi:hypothetical protein
MTKVTEQHFVRDDIRDVGFVICDYCGKKEMDDRLIGILPMPIHLDFGYGSKHDGEQLDFCCDNCLHSWIMIDVLMTVHSPTRTTIVDTRMG